MEQSILQLKKIGAISINDTVDLVEIRDALESTLHVPDERVKLNIIENHVEYLRSKFALAEYKIKVYIAYSDGQPCGYVVSDLNPEYKSYGRKCGTFGWLYTSNFEACKELLKQCEMFAKENKLRRIRGPINFPKNQMGFGLQTVGIQEQMLFGVANPNPNKDLYQYLSTLGYIAESEYICLRVDMESWKKGNVLDRNLKLCCLSLDELLEKVDEIVELAGDSFSTLLPDTSGGGRENIMDLINLAINIPKSYFRYEEYPDLYTKYKHIPEFIEAWKEADLETMITVFPMVLEKKTNKLIGMLIGVLDHYQYWKDEYISRINVHTAMVRKGYNGKGVFSSLNNFGQATNRTMRGTTYFEGTAVWSKNSKGVNNEAAVNSIFPHCTPIRSHVVFEKLTRR